MEKSKFNFLNVLASIVVLGCFVFFFWICKPASNVQNENHNIGEVKTALISVLLLILNFFYGSSKSSQNKDATIQALQSDANSTPSIINTDSIVKNDAKKEDVTL